MDSWLPYLLTCATIAISPGPGSLLTLTVATRQGGVAAMISAIGLLLGAAGHVMLVALGAALLQRALPWLQPILTAAGGAYLVWLGIRLWRARAQRIDPAANPRLNPLGLFTQAILLSASNAKAVVLLLALVPPYVRPDQPAIPQALLLAAGYVAVSGCWHGVLAGLAHVMGRWLRTPRGALAMAGFSAGLFCLFGLWMAWEGLHPLLR
ncbi:LysE family translocator [Rhodovarius crocodyli]|uniref:LysE family translocator n=1 Tax=Rhodovarius crocodyli TaxID=1979269 RepID=A0A437MED6_9PROT|nr:LysE family translocator [Rhodovarius crocodyli]RVT96007.1 LysE family translocator [Rhodovarius crocodyli]